MLFSAKVGAIEISGGEVRVAVIRTGGRTPVICELSRAAAEFETPEEQHEATVRALETALDALKTKPAVYVLCANSMFSIVRAISIPFRGRRRVAQAVQFELEPYLAFPIEELLFDFDIVSEANGQTQVLALGMRRGHLEEQLALLEEAGVEAEAVSLDAVALTGLWCAGRSKLAKGLHAVLHLRDCGASLAFIHNRKLANFRHLQCTAATMRENPAQVAREVQNSLRAFQANWQGEDALEALHLTGMEISPAEREAMEQGAGLPVVDEVMITSLKGADKALEEEDSPVHNQWEAVVGAALGAAGGPFAVDFRRAERDMQGALRGVVSHLMFSAVLALTALVFWGLYYYLGTAGRTRDAAQLEMQVERLTQEIEEISSGGLGDEVDIRAYADPSLLSLLQEIGAKMPGDKVEITEIRTQPPGTRGWWLRITGQVNDAAVFNQVFSDLKTSELFRVDDEPELSLRGQTTTFTVTAYRVSEEEEDGA